MEKKKSMLGRGYISKACRQVGVSTTVYRTAKKKYREGTRLTQKELEVLVRYKEVIKEAEEQLKNL